VDQDQQLDQQPANQKLEAEASIPGKGDQERRG
jgi:hypothetical protein